MDDITMRFTAHRVVVEVIDNFWGRVPRSEKAHKEIAEEIEERCEDTLGKRHSRYAEVSVEGSDPVFDMDGAKYSSLYEALEARFGFEGERGFSFKFRRNSSDSLYSHTGGSFRELIEEAYNNPRDFEITWGELTDEEKAFLQAVLNDRTMKAFE